MEISKGEVSFAALSAIIVWFFIPTRDLFIEQWVLMIVFAVISSLCFKYFLMKMLVTAIFRDTYTTLAYGGIAMVVIVWMFIVVDKSSTPLTIIAQKQLRWTLITFSAFSTIRSIHAWCSIYPLLV